MINIKHIAKLSGLTIKPAEEVLYKNQLKKVLDYISTLKEVDTENIKLKNTEDRVHNRWDEDKISGCISVEDALFNTNSKYNNYFKVKAILKK